MESPFPLKKRKGYDIERWLILLCCIDAQQAFRTSLVTQLVKTLPAMRETWVLSLGWQGPLEKGKAIHSSILAWRIPWTV